MNTVLVARIREILDEKISLNDSEKESKVRIDAIEIAIALSEFAEPMIVYEEDDGIQLFWQQRAENLMEPNPTINVYIKIDSIAEVQIRRTLYDTEEYKKIPVGAVALIIKAALEKMFALQPAI